MSTKKYFLVFLSKYFKYYCIIGSGVDLPKVHIQSKNYILNFLREKHFLKFTNDYCFTFDFEIHIREIITSSNIVIYEQNILEESFSFYLMSEDEIKFLKKDYDLLDNNLIFSSLFFVEDKKIAKYVLNNSNYDFDTILINPIRNYTKSIQSFNLKQKYRLHSV